MGFIICRENRVSSSTAACTSTSTNAVNEKLRFSGKMKIDDVVETGDIDTASSNVRDYEYVNFSRREFCCVNFTRRRIEIGVDECV
jgi:hypothetical protein